MNLKIDRYGIIDTWTGEILPYNPKSKHKDKTFYALYFPHSKTVFDYFIKFMSSTNIVEITDSKLVYTTLNICKASYHNQINSLIRKNICIRLSNTRFFINPEYYIKSSRKSIGQLIKFYNALKNSKEQTIVKTEIKAKVFGQQKEKIEEYEND